jgi:hypothetical protein
VLAIALEEAISSSPDIDRTCAAPLNCPNMANFRQFRARVALHPLVAHVRNQERSAKPKPQATTATQQP